MVSKATVPILISVMAAILAIHQAVAEEKISATQPQSDTELIEITADRLISDSTAKYAEFSGDVRVSQGKFTMTSDTMRIYYAGDLINSQNQPSTAEMIEKIVANGNVAIISDQYTAKTDRVEYDLKALTIVLTGQNSTVKSGRNSITGSKITLHRDDGRINVEGDANSRVNAIFYPEEKTTDNITKGSSKEVSKD